MRKQLVSAIKQEFPAAEITAVGTEFMATSNMLSGERTMRQQARMQLW